MFSVKNYLIRAHKEQTATQKEENFEDETNNMQLDKEDIQQSNLNSKYLLCF